ncbi:MAG: hypothetical protein CMM87_04460 [Rickettsiales bacterium]|nr:hypothetical protein [Rickettsiales bacterium]|tara:strand:- start:24437 stop:25411 length:975 start_codon:yes stop_codon:yes gene_type:complete
MNKKIMTRTLMVALALVTVPAIQLSATGSEVAKKQGYFQRFKESASGVYKSAKQKTVGLAGSARKAVGNKTSSCGTNCANGQVGMEALSYCAFTHPRVPICMKKLAEELQNYKKNLRKKPKDSSANLSKLMETYFDVMSISRDILLQMAKQREQQLENKDYASVLMILKRYYKPVIQSHFFQTTNNHYKQTEAKVIASRADAFFVGYIFHIDGASVAAKGKKRMAYGFVLHTPHRLFDSGQNFTGTLFEVPLKSLRGVDLKNPETRLVTFTDMERRGLHKNVTMVKKTRMGKKKYTFPITSMTSTVTALSDAPPVPPRRQRALA